MGIQKNNRATMKDVANLAGVTIGTVSHVINHTASISQETTRRVLDAIAELHYVPNTMARNMRSKTNHRVGLMIPNLTNNFHARIASNFVDLADKYKYIVYIMGYQYSLEREKKDLRSLMEYNVGTVVIVNGCHEEEYIRKMLDRGIDVILADRHSDIEGVPCVEFENCRVYREIIHVLKEKGYSSIGFISEPLVLTNLKDRFGAYKQGLRENGYELNEDHIFISERLCLDNTKNGYLYMKELLQNRCREELPQVFLATSDLLAIGILRAITEAGYRVPEDFGIVGCDNLQISGYMQPRLTTVMQDRELLSKELWKMILAKDNGEKVENIVLPQKLILRESC
ncbi:MAG: LacI family DNA-binding transcriptional regulator [Eubacteriales bacterium]|nr:LacI family DNA-binding transcriptional regulator [Eubacteriales bacterium]